MSVFFDWPFLTQRATRTMNIAAPLGRPQSSPEKETITMISSAPVNTEPAATTTSTGRQLDGKTALVTGGNSGIGLATAQRLAAEGAHVFLTGRNQDTIDAAVATIGDGATGIRADVSSIDDLTKVAEA